MQCFRKFSIIAENRADKDNQAFWEQRYSLKTIFLPRRFKACYGVHLQIELLILGFSIAVISQQYRLPLRVKHSQT